VQSAEPKSAEPKPEDTRKPTEGRRTETGKAPVRRAGRLAKRRARIAGNPSTSPAPGRRLRRAQLKTPTTGQPAAAGAPSGGRSRARLAVRHPAGERRGPAAASSVDDVPGLREPALAGGPSTALGAGGGGRQQRAVSAQRLPVPSKVLATSSASPLATSSAARPRSTFATPERHSLTSRTTTRREKKNITALEDFKKYGPQAERAGGKLTSSLVALEVPRPRIRKFRSLVPRSIDMEKGTGLQEYTNVGVAGRTRTAALRVRHRDVDSVMCIVELSAELAKASEKRAPSILSLDEMSGGVMTIIQTGAPRRRGFTPTRSSTGRKCAILGSPPAATSPYGTATSSIRVCAPAVRSLTITTNQA